MNVCIGNKVKLPPHSLLSDRTCYFFLSIVTYVNEKYIKKIISFLRQVSTYLIGKINENSATFKYVRLRIHSTTIIVQFILLIELKMNERLPVSDAFEKWNWLLKMLIKLYISKDQLTFL